MLSVCLAFAVGVPRRWASGITSRSLPFATLLVAPPEGLRVTHLAFSIRQNCQSVVGRAAPRTSKVVAGLWLVARVPLCRDYFRLARFLLAVLGVNT